MSLSFQSTMTDREFRRLSEFISAECGIKLPPAKKVMLETRLRKRLRHYKMSSFKEYCTFIFSPGGLSKELIHMIDVVTTNKTDFFRETAHFDYLTQTALPSLLQEYNACLRRSLNVWSVGCSTGEEPYSLAIVLNEFAEKHRGFRFDILATDISSAVINTAQRGIYKDERTQCIPLHLKRKYFLRGKNKSEGTVKVVPELRAMITFKRLNLMEDKFKLTNRMDIIFFRNVMIYFDKKNQEVVLNRICTHLRPNGYMFVGHSETLTGLYVPSLRHELATIYRKTVNAL